jgi:hypothetical protein
MVAMIGKKGGAKSPFCFGFKKKHGIVVRQGRKI